MATLDFDSRDYPNYGGPRNNCYQIDSSYIAVHMNRKVNMERNTWGDAVRGTGKGWVEVRGKNSYRIVAKDRNRVNIYEHRLLVEKRLGRPLTEDEVVHHKNENTLDNNDENLLVTTIGEHNTIHAKRSRRWLRLLS